MHYQNHHNEKLSKQMLYDNISIIQKELNNQKLIITEIIEKTPSLNGQKDNFSCTLKLYENNYHNTKQTC